MTDLQVRKLSFSFDDRTPFQWNPANPAFGVSFNGFTFIAPAFERYMVAATRMAMKEITDDGVRAEADAFLRQEALHARAHRNHVAALTRQHPGLARISRELDRRFDALLATRTLPYHLAYAADIEATFTPMFDLMLRHKAHLFDNGDPDVAPLFLWHLVEEIEHRSSAQMIYDAVVPSPWYRLRVAPEVFRHLLGCFNVAVRGFDAHVPRSVRLVDAADLVVSPGQVARALAQRLRSGGAPAAPNPLASVSWRETASLVHRLARSQRPGHSPAGERTPPFADEWFAAYDRGHDVVHWYDAPAEGGP